MPAPHILLARTCALGALLILAACAQRAVTRMPAAPRPALPTPYLAPPPSQDAAPVAMRGNVPAGSYYIVNVFANTQTCTGSQLVGRSLGRTDLSATALATERWQTLEVAIDEPAQNLRCTVRISFTPRHGRSYLLAPKLADHRCSAYVFDTTERGEPQLESSFRLRNADNEECTPLASAPKATKDPLQQISVSASELPIDPDEGALSPEKAPRAAAAGPKAPESVSVDDLKSLIKH